MTPSAGASPADGDARRWRLRPTYELFPAGNGDVYLLQAGGPTVVVRQPDAEDRRLLDALDGGDVTVAPDSHEAARIKPLIEAEVVVPVSAIDLDDDEAERFDRQLGYLAEFGDPARVQLRLRGATIAVLGCGGVGTWTLGALAGLGIGRFVLIDDDRVELSNLNRQVLYRTSDVGASKVERAAAWLNDFDDQIAVEVVSARVTDHDALDSLLPPCDLLVMAADSPPHELPRWVNRVAVERRMPFTTAGLQTPLARIGPIYCPGQGPCYACHEEQTRSRFPLYEELAEHQNRSPPRAITIGPGAGIVGSMIANDVLNLLGAGRPATADRALIVDLRDLRCRFESVGRDLDCPVCARLFPTAATSQGF